MQQWEFCEETGIYLRDVAHNDCSVMKIHIPYFSWQTFIALTKGSIQRPRTNGEFSSIKWILLDEIHKLPSSLLLKPEIRRFKRYIESHRSGAKLSMMQHETILQHGDIGNKGERYALNWHLLNFGELQKGFPRRIPGQGNIPFYIQGISFYQMTKRDRI